MTAELAPFCVVCVACVGSFAPKDSHQEFTQTTQTTQKGASGLGLVPVWLGISNSLRLDITTVKAGQRVGVANDGYWGIPVRPNTTYTASFYARASRDFKGPLAVAIEGLDGKVFVAERVSSLSPGWHKYSLKLKTGKLRATAEARFVLSASSPGSVWFSLVSLFPPTYKNRANGMRIDIMERLAAMKPSFLRFPGGNYLEGRDFANRFNWKATIGPLEERPGHMSPWSYRSTDGVGLLEFLNWCEDLNMEPIVGVYAGLHLDGGRTTITGDALKPSRRRRAAKCCPRSCRR
jgi:alpha-N-arabinofuranosidase